ncbi:hypothetical protein SMC26_10855 [Actinomadura fulvescens]|uniref:Uncharacterized protein n=1 Tax=Actinomadura fulvescens TaxID=46160 RepID=A0ABN3Q0T2_9ACTN
MFGTKSALTVAALASGVVLLSASGAHAEVWNDKRDTTGAWAHCWVSTANGKVRDQYAYISCYLKDTKADRNRVYVAWWQDGFGGIHLENKKGAGKTITVRDGRYNRHGAFVNLKWKVCRDRPGRPDNCSSRVTHKTR